MAVITRMPASVRVKISFRARIRAWWWMRRDKVDQIGMDDEDLGRTDEGETLAVSGRENTRNERAAGFLSWERAHPRDGEICLVARTPTATRRSSTIR